MRERALFEWLEANMEHLLARDPAAIAHAVIESCRIKADIVAADEREHGERALLNFGHTFAHAIEAGEGYGAWLHGEAVAAGMLMAACLSQRVAGLSSPERDRLQALIARAGLPVRPPSLPRDRWLELMSRDKKTQHGTLRFVLLRALGEGAVGAAVPEVDLRHVLAQ